MRPSRVAALVAILASIAVASAGPARAAADPGIAQQWGLTASGAPDAWATGSGEGITIAVVDTGVDLGHEDLTSRLMPGKNFVDPSKTPQDDHGHGTHVAGIAAGVTNNGRGIASVAPDARILPVKVMNAEGKSVDSGGQDSVAAGIRYAADQGAQVINLSLGDAGITAVLGPSFAEAVRYAWSKGSICVVSAGNSGQNNLVTSSNFSNEPAIVVTSVDRSGTKPGYASNVGSAKWAMAAPGGAANGNAPDDILSTWWVAGRPNTYAFVAGTSMAAPHVSGAAAVLRSLGLTPQQTVDRLLATARDVGDRGRDNVYGSGALDVKAAVAGYPPKPGPSVTTTTTNRKSTGTTRARTGTTQGTTATAGGSTETTSTTESTIPTIDPPDDKTGGPGDDSLTASGPDDPPSGGGEDRPWPLLAVAGLALAGPLTLLRRIRPG